MLDQQFSGLELPVPPSLPKLRRHNIEARRMRIIRAARNLISQNVEGNFSMIELAERAGVSLATPYNLFGSKQAVLRELFRLERQAFERRSLQGFSGAAHRRILMTANNLASIFVQEPDYYRNLARTLTTLAVDDFRSHALLISGSVFKPLIDTLIEDGAIETGIEPALISAHLMRIFNSTFFLWAGEGWDGKQLRREMKIGFALCFAGLFRPAERESLLTLAAGLNF